MLFLLLLRARALEVNSRDYLSQPSLVVTPSTYGLNAYYNLTFFFLEKDGTSYTPTSNIQLMFNNSLRVGNTEVQFGQTTYTMTNCSTFLRGQLAKATPAVCSCTGKICTVSLGYAFTTGYLSVSLGPIRNSYYLAFGGSL
jgi:hypothetical protein